MRFRRFVVEGDSMLPTLRSGDYVVGHRVDQVAVGDVVAFEHPGRQGFWLIKRVVAIHGTVDLDTGTVDGVPYVDRFRQELVESGWFEIGPGEMFVLSDNRAATRVDSRMFGSVPVEGGYRIRLRYWRRPGRV